jgi:hypothetical protein
MEHWVNLLEQGLLNVSGTLQEQARLSGQGSATDVVSPGKRVDDLLELEEVSLN